MLPTRRVAPSCWMQMKLLALCVWTVGFSISDGITSTALGEESVLVDQRELIFEPYSVYVAAEKSYARCGPAQDYYRTDPLRMGQELEVYAETDDGWLGIRPPEDSFCWVPAETVQKNDGELDGIISEDRTVAWIGTHLGRARSYRWQVQLAKGEPVTVIGQSEREGPDGPQLWYRIVPPSGEYRWVHRDVIVNSSEELVAVMQQVSGKETIKVFPRDRPAAETKSVVDADRSPRRLQDLDLKDDVGPSVLARNEDRPDRDSKESVAVGSGLNDQWRDRVRRDTEVQTASFSRDSQQSDLLEMSDEPSAPDSDQSSAESSWVAGNSPVGDERLNLATPASLRTPDLGPSVGSFIARGTNNGLGTNNALGANNVLGATGHPSLRGTLGVGNEIMQTGAMQATSGVIAPASKTLTYVSAERLAQIESEARQADIEKLDLIFSRLMASRATAIETAPVSRAASNLSATSPNPLVVGRARMLLDRVERYRQVAHRRDGEVVVRDAASFNSPGNYGRAVLPVTHNQPIQSGSNAGPLYQGTVQSEAVKVANATGTLVQVYSARTNSPPYALTDQSGRTIAYITPIPGVNLRTHLNHRVSVFGNRGFLTGLNTPHIVATQAVRAQ